MRINGIEVSSGCIIDGHWGQYGPDRLADIAGDLGCPLGELGDPRELRELAESYDVGGSDPGAGDAAYDAWERYLWAAEAILDWCNDHAEGCAVWWEDGELFIIAACPACGSFEGHDRLDGSATCMDCGERYAP